MRFLDDVSSNLFGNFIVIASVMALTVLTFISFGQNSKGVEFFVDEEPDIATVFVQARGNLSGQDIRDIGIEVENQVLQVAGIENVVMTATAPGGGGSGGGITLGAPQDMPADVVVTMQIELADYAVRRKAVEIFDEITRAHRQHWRHQGRDPQTGRRTANRQGYRVCRLTSSRL